MCLLMLLRISAASHKTKDCILIWDKVRRDVNKIHPSAYENGSGIGWMNEMDGKDLWTNTIINE